ncbi:DUF2690 domain-containing protein [Streptomyces phytohabitans]|uniref:DUF2690 domain-containing protein n=1 Tax=Streptomyces phytohabitans TaxID=1150371 RepID=UPI00345B9A4C
MALTVAVVGGVAPVLVSDWLAPDPSSCPGSGCGGKAPQSAGCDADAVSLEPPRDNPVRLMVRYSERCDAVWAKVIRARAGDKVTIRVAGGDAESEVVNYGRDQYTRMTYAPGSFTATACAVPSTQSPRTWTKYCTEAEPRSPWR